MDAPIMTPKRKAQQASPIYSWARERQNLSQGAKDKRDTNLLPNEKGKHPELDKEKKAQNQ